LVITPIPPYVATKDSFAYAVNPPTVTVIGAYVVPSGTVTVSDSALAVWFVACTDPKKTILFEAISLKLVPVIMTLAPALVALGLNPVITGGPDAAQTEAIARHTHPSVNALTFIGSFPKNIERVKPYFRLKRVLQAQ
jgi:hypothetical protein